MKLPSSAISEMEARSRGYSPLTTCYELPAEREFLDKAQRDLKGVDFVLVGDASHPEIWRKGMILADGCAIQIPLDPIRGRIVTV